MNFRSVSKLSSNSTHSNVGVYFSGQISNYCELSILDEAIGEPGVITIPGISCHQDDAQLQKRCCTMNDLEPPPFEMSLPSTCSTYHFKLRCSSLFKLSEVSYYCIDCQILVP